MDLNKSFSKPAYGYGLPTLSRADEKRINFLNTLVTRSNDALLGDRDAFNAILVMADQRVDGDTALSEPVQKAFDVLTSKTSIILKNLGNDREMAEALADFNKVLCKEASPLVIHRVGQKPTMEMA